MSIKGIAIILLILPLGVFGQNRLVWEAPLEVNSDVTKGWNRPKIALTTGGVPIVMWGKANNREVYLARWDGEGFGSPVRVTPEGMNAFVQNWAGPSMDARGDTVFVAFKSQPENEGFVYTVRSVDGGKTFGDTVRVSDWNYTRFPEVSVLPGGDPVVNYMNFESGFLEPHYSVAVSNDRGMTYGDNVDVSAGAAGEACDCCPGFVLAEKDRIITLFRNNDNNLRDMWATVSIDGGKSFDRGADIDANNWEIGSCPSSGADGVTEGDSLLAVWMSGASGYSRINIGKVDLGNIGVGLNAELTPGSTANQNYPKVAGSGRQVVVVWQEANSGSLNILARASTSGIRGVLDSPTDTVNLPLTGSRQNPDIASDGDVFHVIWQDNRNRKVMYRRGRISGSSGLPSHSTEHRREIYPNPSTGIVHLTGSSQIEDIAVFTSNGVPVQVDFEGDKLDLSPLKNGVYLVEIQDQNGGRIVHRMIKMH